MAELLRIGGLPERVHMAEEDSRELGDLLRARQQLVKSATSLMHHLRGLLRQEGIRLKAEAFHGEDTFLELKNSKDIPWHMKAVIDSYQRSIEELLRERSELDEEIKEIQKQRHKSVKERAWAGRSSLKDHLCSHRYNRDSKAQRN